MTTNNLQQQQQQRFPSHKEQFISNHFTSLMLTPERIKTLAGPGSNERNGPLLTLLGCHKNLHPAYTINLGGTALHVAASAGKLKVVEELVKLMSEKELEIKDDRGNTALSSAATVGITKMAECLLSKNQNLVTFLNENKYFPLVEACICNYKDMALYLYSVTPVEFLCQDNGHHGSSFLQCAIIAQMLDIAFDFLHRFPYMTTTMDGVLRSNPLLCLSTMPALFHSGNRLALWQQWIYSCIPIEPIATGVLSKLRGFAINLLTFLGIKKIYDLKKMHNYSDKILECMCEHISKLDYRNSSRQIYMEHSNVL
uniref:Uncharacterized protein n=1 Tax=Salix viminalis TaxID=40686 RepID=A0A6N2LQJ9_SALVM